MENIPPTTGFSNFIKKYRKIINIECGGKKEVKKYNSATSKILLSITKDDRYESLPARISLSNFKNGPPILSYGCILRYNGDDVVEPHVSHL